MEIFGIWVSGIIVVIAILKALIYLFSDHGSMSGPKTRYTINDGNDSASDFCNNDNNDFQTNPFYSHLPGNIWYDNSSDFDDY